MKRWILVVLVVGLILAMASLLWAMERSQKQKAPAIQACPPNTSAHAMTGKMPSQAKEHKRCVVTCNTVMPFHRRKYAALKTHEGDTQCWHNCWNRFGDTTQTNVSLSDKKQLWQGKNAQYLRANQCAQTCYRRFHNQKAQPAIEVAGAHSRPRAWVAADQASARVMAGQAMMSAQK